MNESQSNLHSGCKIQTPRHYQFYFSSVSLLNVVFTLKSSYNLSSLVKNGVDAKMLSNSFVLVFKVKLDRLQFLSGSFSVFGGSGSIVNHSSSRIHCSLK